METVIRDHEGIMVLTNRVDGVLPVQGPGHHVDDRHAHQAHDHQPGLRNAAAPLGKRSVAHIDVALDCQGKCQPVGGSVEDLRSCLQEKLKQEARLGSPGLSSVTSQGVVEHVPWIRWNIRNKQVWAML